jgi:hypothetical protein
MAYLWKEQGYLILDTDSGALIPWPPAESLGFAVQAWIDEGNVIADPAPDPVAAKAAHNAPILVQIAAIDVFIPRGLEDTWAAMGFDTTKLPAIQQSRLAQKIALRAQLQA